MSNVSFQPRPMDSRVQSPVSVVMDRLKQARTVRPQWHAMCDSDTLHFVQQYANSLGCQEEQIFFPLLSLSASMMAANASIEITDTWTECPALWFAVVARRGEGKSSILKLLKKGLPRADPDLRLLDETTFEIDDLCALRPERRLVAMFENVALIHQRCEGRRNPHVLTSLYNGQRPYADEEETTLNVCGFMHPRDLILTLSRDELHPIANQFLYVCPLERDCFMEDLTPVHKSTPSLATVFHIIADAHQKRVTYHFNPQAKEMVNEYLNELIMHRRSIPDDENRRYVLSSARAQFCRLALVCHVFKHALKEAVARNEVGTSDDQWHSSVIKVESIRHARECMNYLLDTKLNLLPSSGGDAESRSEKSYENSQPETTWRPAQKDLYYNGEETPAEPEQSVFPTSTAVPQTAGSNFPFTYTNSPTMVPPLSALAATPNGSLYNYPHSPDGRLAAYASPRLTPQYYNCRQRTPVVQGVEMNGVFHYDFSNLLPWAAKNLRSLLTSGHPEISASIVAGRHLMPPTKTPGTENRYKTGAAIAYLYSVADLGFGTIYRTNKRSVVFKKNPYDQLPQSAKDILTKIQVTEDSYSRVKLSMMDEKKKADDIMMTSSLAPPYHGDMPIDLAMRNGVKAESMTIG